MVFQKGIKFSEEHRKNLSLAHEGQKPWNKGKKHSKETKNKIRKKAIERLKDPTKNPFYGKKHSEESKKEISKNHWSKRGFKHPMLGKHRSEETKKKMSQLKTKFNIPKEILEKLYLKNGLTTMDLGKRFGFSPRTILDWLKKYGILIRTNSERNSKNKNPAWRGGISRRGYIFSQFNKELKEQIRKRDNYRCQECSIHQNELKKRLGVHHIDFNKKNNHPNNLISLCPSCHTQTNFKREDWTKYFQEKIK